MKIYKPTIDDFTNSIHDHSSDENDGYLHNVSCHNKEWYI